MATPTLKRYYRHVVTQSALALQVTREAITGSDQDYTSGPFNRAIALLAIPMMLEMLMESIFAIVDIFFVARLGADAVATLGITEAVITLLYAISIGFSMAVTAIVARRIGEHDAEGAAVTAAQAIVLGCVVTLIISVGGVIFAEDILRLMGANQASIEKHGAYTAIMFGGSGSILFLFVLNGVFRGAGDAVTAMRVLWIANGINIILDPCLIFGLGPFPELGLAGAAIATTIGRTAGVALQLYYLFRGHTRVALRLHHLRPRFTEMNRLIYVSTGGITQYLIATSSWVFLVKIIASYGSAAVAGYTIAIRIIDFMILPAWGLSNAAATLVGQNLGAKKPARAEEFVWRVARFNFIFLGVIGVVFVVSPEPIVHVFTTEVETVAHAANCMRCLGYGFGFFAIGLVLNQAFNGAGDTMTPTKINFVAFWMLQIPLAYWLANDVFNSPQGVFVAILIGESFMTVLAIFVFRRGSWKTVNV